MPSKAFNSSLHHLNNYLVVTFGGFLCVIRYINYEQVLELNSQALMGCFPPPADVS